MGSVGSKKWKNKAVLVEKNNSFPWCLPQILLMSNKNDFMKIYSVRNRKKKKGKKVS